MSYFDPAGLARIGNLELIAKQVVEGFLTGKHRSPYHGFSVEYLDHRSYTPGDDMRMLDWKVVARSDKYTVKLFEDETNLRATILLDCSRSMDFGKGGPASEQGLSKLQWGSYLAAALAYLLIRQNDSVGLMLFDTKVRTYIPPKAHPTQFRRILDSLDGVEPGGETDCGTVLHEAAERLKRRGLVIVISDLIDNEDSVASGLQHFRHNNHEVIVFHTLDDAELNFPFERITRFQDMEGAGRVVVNPNSLRKKYLERIKAFTQRLEDDCHERKISYNLANTKEAYSPYLAAFLDKRHRLG
jgi:uncharacterized protein (DUF58 family)